ncbi:topoisomerase IV [uncultured Methanobrevibacter sp.]|uniref:topoisomerase IV n=1 Tax=uncultured Methanobrevibacter sp. TaxID=253161 RepID=UPI00262C7658|nr:topoisomerase IV [uncultured Methanobrevibacter sp.]
MKKSKENEHRISNLKDMLNNVKDDESIDDADDVFNVSDNKEYEEDEELLAYLHDNDTEEYEINDEFIYRPDSDSTPAENLEKQEINKDFIIKTKLDYDEFSEDNKDYFEEPTDSTEGELSESFDNLVNAKIGGTPIIGIVSLAIGILLIIGSIIMSTTASDRVIDNVSSGEHNSVVVVLIILGILLTVFGIYKIFGFEHANKLTNSIKKMNIESEDEEKETTIEEKVIPKSNIPLDKESYKIGEFDMGEFKENLKKPVSKTEKSSSEPTIEEVPPAKERPDDEKGLSIEEIEEIEYEKASLDNESIDEIFSTVEEIDDIPLVDSKKNKK